MARESFGVAVLAWPISLGVGALALIALAAGSPLKNSEFRRRLRVPLISYAFPFAILLVGYVLRYDGPPHPHWVEPPKWHGVPISALLIAHTAALIAAPILAKGARVRVVALLLPGLWLSWCASLIAGIAVAGVGP
jgi:hypothetical protein